MVLWEPREEAVPRGERGQMCDKSRERTRRSLVTVMGSFIRVCRGVRRAGNVDWGRFQREREGRGKGLTLRELADRVGLRVILTFVQYCTVFKGLRHKVLCLILQ